MVIDEESLHVFLYTLVIYVICFFLPFSMVIWCCVLWMCRSQPPSQSSIWDEVFAESVSSYHKMTISGKQQYGAGCSVSFTRAACIIFGCNKINFASTTFMIWCNQMRAKLDVHGIYVDLLNPVPVCFHPCLPWNYWLSTTNSEKLSNM